MAEESLFTKIITRQIPARIEHEDDRYIVIHDINPQAPVHLLVIPKKQIATLNDLEPGDAELVGGMFLLAGKMMKRLGHSDYRAVINCGAVRSRRYSTFISMSWAAGHSHGRRDSSDCTPDNGALQYLRAKKKTPPFKGSVSSGGEKMRRGASISGYLTCQFYNPFRLSQ